MAANAEALEEAAASEAACEACGGSGECRAPQRFRRSVPSVDGPHLELWRWTCPVGMKQEQWAVERARAERLLLAAELPPGWDHMRLETFHTLPPSAEYPHGTEKAFRLAQEVASWAGKTQGKGLLFSGPSGCGKTHLAVGIMLRWLEAGLPGVYKTTPKLLDILREQQASPKMTETMDLLCRIRFLGLDDIGAEIPTRFALERLFIITNDRDPEKTLTVGSTNLTLDELEHQLGQRIVSRLLRLCEWCPMDGPDGGMNRWWES